MMKLQNPNKVLQLIRESLLNEALPATLQKKVGNVLFGDKAWSAKIQGAKVNVKTDKGLVAEPNTKWESELYNKIRGWTFSSSDVLAKYFKKNKALLDTLAQEFPKLLQPPIGKKVYRGTSIKISSLINAFKTKDFDVVKVAGKEYFHFKNLKYSPMRDSQSWTVNYDAAFKFSGKSDAETQVQVIYTTIADESFIFSPTLLNNIFGGDEQETIRVAKSGTFEAYVNVNKITTIDYLETENFFIHKIPSAAPFFEKLVTKYNKTKSTRKDGKKITVKSMDQLLKLSSAQQSDWGRYEVEDYYQKATKEYIKSLK